MLCVKDVSLRLPETCLLENVNFTVNKGDIVTLMGPSGCGKSTLFSWMIGALAGQFSCTGELWLNEQRLDTLPTARRQIGILFQDVVVSSRRNTSPRRHKTPWRAWCAASS